MRYKSDGGINPFIVAPERGRMQQQLVVAPSEIVSHPEDLTDLVSKFTLDLGPEIPYISQINWFHGLLVVSITVQTQVKEPFSGREGLNVTFGALVATSELGRYGLCTDIIETFQRYFRSAFKDDITVEAVSRILRGKEDQADPWSFDLLRYTFASLLESQRLTNPLRRIVAQTKLSRVAPRSMDSSFAEALRYWSQVDRMLRPQEDLPYAEGGNSPVIIELGLVALCVAQLLGFTAAAWPNAPRYWRTCLAFTSALTTLSTVLIMISNNTKARPTILKIAGLVALAAAALGLVVSAISLSQS